MLAEIYSGALTGIEAYAVSFELNAGHGEPRRWWWDCPMRR